MVYALHYAYISIHTFSITLTTDLFTDIDDKKFIGLKIETRF